MPKARSYLIVFNNKEEIKRRKYVGVMKYLLVLYLYLEYFSKRMVSCKNILYRTIAYIFPLAHCT